MRNLKTFDDGKVVLVSTEPSKSINRYTNEKMKMLEQSSQRVLKRLAEIQTMRVKA
ncbi:hypothetical protein ACFW35_01485 [Fictibacillus sp. NPDC058756]|jgi:hypothetical protein|uniref:hypothetical protein n=1 Tax=Fictibacillus sp. NPDC058756 TaxID=3346625 RepID=UPI0036BCAB88